jgi:hypothetical protein
MLKKRYHIAVVTAALALTLTGCTGGGGGGVTTSSSGGSVQSSAPAESGDQSKAEACQIVQDSLAEFSELSSDMNASDPQGVVDKFKELYTNATTSLGEITNAEVKPAATAAAAALGEYVEFLQTAISDPSKLGDMSAKVTALQESLTEVGTLCAS